jgi:hypothetical protein
VAHSDCSGSQYAKIKSNEHVRLDVGDSGRRVESVVSDTDAFWVADGELESDGEDARAPLGRSFFGAEAAVGVVDDEDDDASDDSAFVDEEEISFSESGSEGLESGSDDDDDDDDDEQRVYIKWDWSVCVPVGCVW